MYALTQTISTPSFIPVRGVPADVLPGQRNGRPFSFTTFNTVAPVTAFAESARVIVEQNGIFCIAEVFEPSPLALDMEFKQLVDSVMGTFQAIILTQPTDKIPPSWYPIPHLIK